MLLRARVHGSRAPKASPSLLPLRDATRRTREQCVRARGCARANTLVSIRGGRVCIICICVYYVCVCVCMCGRVWVCVCVVYVCMCVRARVGVCVMRLCARCTVASTHVEAPARWVGRSRLPELSSRYRVYVSSRWWCGGGSPAPPEKRGSRRASQERERSDRVAAAPRECGAVT